MKRLRPTLFPRRKPTRRSLLKIYQVLFRHYGHRGWWPGQTPFEVIVGAILTQNTAWRNVEKAIANLKREHLLTPTAMRKVARARLATLIRSAGYFNIKTDRIKSFVDFLWAHYRGSLKRMFQTEVERLRNELLNVKGIGEETADSILLYAGGKLFFVVDAYTRRVLARHRYLGGDEDYSDIQRIFSQLLPKSTNLYNDYHAQLVEVGKGFCKTQPVCESCPLRSLL